MVVCVCVGGRFNLKSMQGQPHMCPPAPWQPYLDTLGSGHPSGTIDGMGKMDVQGILRWPWGVGAPGEGSWLGSWAGG